MKTIRQYIIFSLVVFVYPVYSQQADKIGGVNSENIEAIGEVNKGQIGKIGDVKICN